MQKFFGIVGGGDGAGGYHIFHFAVTPADGDGGDAVNGGALNVKNGVADHHGIGKTSAGFQQVGNDRFLAVAVGIGGGTADQGEILGKIKTIQNLVGHKFRLGGGHIQLVSLGKQSFQQFPDAGINFVFVDARDHIMAAIDPDGLGNLIFRNTQLEKTSRQGRADKTAHFLSGRKGQTELLQGAQGAVDDTGAGVGEGAVQIKQNCFSHIHLPFFSYTIA